MKLIPLKIVMGRWMLMARESFEVNTGAYYDGKMKDDGKGIM